MNAVPLEADAAPLDVLIVGAGVSGLGAACHLSREMPQKSYAILEARDKLGGTWELFRYPGVRSDSDLPTYAYAFKPWKSRKTFAGADEILAYLRAAAAEHGVDKKIRYRCKALAADWDSASALWRVTVLGADAGSETTVRCRWLFVATGYYDYERGHHPDFRDEKAFRGPILHPQAWPEGFDAKGKRIAVIGSGATAVTLVPALAEAGAQVTQIQRTPSYILPFPSEDLIASALRRILPETTAYAIARRKNILLQQWLYAFFQRYPKAARRFLRWTNRRLLPKGYPVDVHFNPPYDPWDQRLCIAPDGDFLKAIRSGRVSIVTGGIERFTPGGVRMNSGEEIAADVIVAATGLVVTLLRGMRLSLDRVPVDLPERMVFKATMLDGVPNLCFVFGYVNASWTLRADLISRFFCRLLKALDARGEAVCVVQRPEGETGDRPLFDFRPGYIERALSDLPRQGLGPPWVMSASYALDERLLMREPVIDPAMRLKAAPSTTAVRSEPVA
jgi:cation diffusion facilitator CzcD-associated flavoprotein CzcO